jgi:hypothetical protein
MWSSVPGSWGVQETMRICQGPEADRWTHRDSAVLWPHSALGSQHPLSLAFTRTF